MTCLWWWKETRFLSSYLTLSRLLLDLEKRGLMKRGMKEALSYQRSKETKSPLHRIGTKEKRLHNWPDQILLPNWWLNNHRRSCELLVTVPAHKTKFALYILAVWWRQRMKHQLPVELEWKFCANLMVAKHFVETELWLITLTELGDHSQSTKRRTWVHVKLVPANQKPKIVHIVVPLHNANAWFYIEL